MTAVEVIHNFTVSADTLWELIGDFGDMDKWSTGGGSCVVEGDGIGALRTVTTADGRVIIERLEAETELSYSYSIVSSPLPVESYEATLALVRTGKNSCQLQWSSRFEPKKVTEEQAVAYIEKIYGWGIGMMKETLANSKS